MNTIKIISALREGDPSVMRLIFFEYHERVYSYVLKQTNSSYIAEETVQLTFIKLWQYRKSLSFELSLLSQIFRITRTTMIDQIRLEKTNKNSTTIIRNQSLSIRDVSDKIEENELTNSINLLIRKMPGAQKKVFEMSRFEGMTYKDIALELSISVKTVEAHISHALKFLRSHLPVFILLILTAG